MNQWIIPIFVLVIILYGFQKKVDLYNSFLEGAKEGLVTTFKVAPSVVGMVFAINLFLNSNFLEDMLSFLLPFLNKIHVPMEILPMAFVRPISGTASLAILNNLFTLYGPDSYIGRLASTIQGCTDTTIYVLALYFGSIKVKKTGHALKAGLFADLVGIVASIVLVSLFFH